MAFPLKSQLCSRLIIRLRSLPNVQLGAPPLYQVFNLKESQLDNRLGNHLLNHLVSPFCIQQMIQHFSRLASRHRPQANHQVHHRQIQLYLYHIGQQFNLLAHIQLRSHLINQVVNLLSDQLHFLVSNRLVVPLRNHH